MSTDLLTQLKALHLYGMAQAWTEFRAEGGRLTKGKLKYVKPSELAVTA